MLPLHRVSRRSTPGEAGVMMEPTSTRRERLLLNQEGADAFSGHDASASRFGVSDGGGAEGAEAQPSRLQGGEIVDKMEGIV